MMKIVFCLKRHPSMTRAEFQDYWRHKHAPLVMARAKLLGIMRYVQSHTVDDAIFARASAARGGHPPFDGVAELWYGNAPQHGTPEERRQAAQELLDDERKFIDLTASPLFITEEHEIIQGPAA